MKRAHPSVVHPELPSAKGAPHIGSFLSKTFTIFNTDSYSQYCGFSPDGEKIVIHNVHEFAAKILPRHFKHSNMQSFVRQLNMYGFRKIPSEPATAQFRHPNFKRGRPDLLSGIKRKSAEERKQDAQAKARNAGEALLSSQSGPSSVAITTTPKSTPADVAQMQHTLLSIWERLSRLESSTAAQMRGGGQTNGNSTAMDIPVSMGMGIFNQSGVVPGVDLTSIPKHTDRSLNDLVSLRESLDRLQSRMAAMEVDHRSLLNQNKALWEHLDNHQKRQSQLQNKLQGILMFMYQMHLRMGGTSSQRSITQSQDLQLPGANAPISGLAESLFNDNIQYLCMEHPIPGATGAGSQPIIQHLASPQESPASALPAVADTTTSTQSEIAPTSTAVASLSQESTGQADSLGIAPAPVPMVESSAELGGGVQAPELLRSISLSSLDFDDNFAFDSPLPFPALDSIGTTPVAESASKKPRLDEGGGELERLHSQGSEDFWDVLLGIDDNGTGEAPSVLPEDYKTSVAAIASNSSLLAEREARVNQALEGIASNLSTAANISTVIEQKTDSPAPKEEKNS